MKMKLSLAPETFYWSAVNPFYRGNTKEINEDVLLVLTQSNPGPVEVNIEDLPLWAKNQIDSSIKSGSIINTGEMESIAITKDDRIEEKVSVPVAKAKQTRTSKKKIGDKNDPTGQVNPGSSAS